MGHYSEHIAKMKSGGMSHLLDNRSSFLNNYGVKSPAPESPLPQALMAQGSEISTPPEPTPGMVINK